MNIILDLKLKAYRWDWQADLIKPREFLDLTYRVFCAVLIIILKDKAPFSKEVIKEAISIWSSGNFGQKLKFIIICFFSIILELLQFIVYYICLPFRIFSEWFCSLSLGG